MTRGSLIRRDAVLALVEKAGLLSDPEDGLRLIANGVLALPAGPVGEADDDVVLRAEVFAALDKRMEREEYGHAKAAVALDIEAVGRIPRRRVGVDPVSEAERRVAKATLAWHNTKRISVSADEYRAIEAEGVAALDAYRAAVAARAKETR